MNDLNKTKQELLQEIAKLKEHIQKQENQSFDFYKQAFNKISIPLCHVDNTTGEIKELNKRFTELFGYTIDEIPSLDEWWEFAYPDEKYRKWVVNNWSEAVEYSIKNKSDITPDVYDVRCKNGDVKNIFISGITIGDEFVATFFDFTDQIKINDKLERILEGTNAGTWDWDIQTGSVAFNERWANIMGKTLKELEPIDITTWINNVHPDDLPHANELLQLLFNQEIEYYDVEFRQPHKDGSWVWVNARGKVIERSKEGKPLRMSGTHLDITERKIAEEELKEHRNNLEILIQKRTKELEQKNKELDEALKVFIGRELTIKELQNKLKNK